MSHMRKRERGAALILVIGALVLLSIIGTTFVAMMRIERSAARNFHTDAQLRQLAMKALAFCLQHPNWDPNDGPGDLLVDNDNSGRADSRFITEPLLSLVSQDIHPRWAILKRPFGGRVNVNWNSFFIGPANENHALNEGTHPGEVSLVDPITAYLDFMGASGLPFVGTPAQNREVAEEIARRIVNFRYGRPLRPLAATGPYPEGTDPAYKAYPGEDFTADDDWLNDPTLGTADDPPLGNHPVDLQTFIAPNWRPQPHRDGVDNTGDGIADRLWEELDQPWEFSQHIDTHMATWPGDPWPYNDDQPFGSADLEDIVFGTGDSDLRKIVNDVCQFWAPGQGFGGFDPTVDYFGDYLRYIFTTENLDFIGGMTPLNHLNFLMPNDPTDQQRAIVERDRGRFISTLAAVLSEEGMDTEGAALVAWQVMANLIDFLDGNDLVTPLVRSEGWDPFTDDLDGTGRPSPGEPNTRTFFGTERQPYINELWIYNRSDDRFDNDGDGYIDDEDRFDPEDPGPQEPYEEDRDGYFIELFNHYATDIVLYNNPADPGDLTIDWYLRILDNGVEERYRFSDARVWQGGTGGSWEPAAGTSEIVVPAGGYLIIQSRDWAEHDNDALEAADIRQLPDYRVDNIPDGAVLIDLDLGEETVLFEAGYTIELVHSYFTDGSDLDSEIAAVVDRQQVPDEITTIETALETGLRDFAPSWERQDPRLSRVVRDPQSPDMGFGIGDEMLPTFAYRHAEDEEPDSGGDQIWHTLGEVNGFDANESGMIDPGEIFLGNYDLGAPGIYGFDDLVDIPNSFTWKFATPAALGKLLAVGPLPPEPADYGWSDPEDVGSGDPDYWLIESSPYTQVPGTSTNARNRPLDVKKVSFTLDEVHDFSGQPFEPDGAPSYLPTGRARGIFDRFTTICPWKDGKDNDGDWDHTVDDRDGAGWPTPGDGHVDEADEVYVPGRIDVNHADAYVLSALPYVTYNDSLLYRPGVGNVPGVFLTVRDCVHTGAEGILSLRQRHGSFESRKEFLEHVVIPAVNADEYDPATGEGAFGRDTEDNHRFEDDTGTPIREARPYRWQTLQQPPRTEYSDTSIEFYDPPPAAATPDFILPGALGDGGDLLIDDKSEVDYTVGALMNWVGLDMEIPSAFGGGDGVGIYTYFITVQLTDGRDVAPGLTEPVWGAGRVLGEKRIVALVDTARPITDPRRVQVFNWSIEGRSPAR